MTILAVGPRELPRNELVEVWLDAGSGSVGQQVMVSVKRLALSELDQGKGATALYEYEPNS